jgi:hypothetical protein
LCCPHFKSNHRFINSQTVPVNVGEAKFALNLKRFCVAVETGLFTSLVIVHISKPTIVLSIPETVPVKVGEAKFALNLMQFGSS